MKYSFVAFNYRNHPINYITVVIGSYDLDEIKARAQVFVLENKKNPMVYNIMLKAGIDLLNPSWYENYKIK